MKDTHSGLLQYMNYMGMRSCHDAYMITACPTLRDAAVFDLPAMSALAAQFPVESFALTTTCSSHRLSHPRWRRSLQRLRGPRIISSPNNGQAERVPPVARPPDRRGWSCGGDCSSSARSPIEEGPHDKRR